MILSPLLHAIGYILCIRVAVMGARCCPDRDCARCIRAKVCILAGYALLMARLYDIDPWTARGLVRWTLKTGLLLAVPLWHRVLQSEPVKPALAASVRNYLLAPVLEEIVFRGPQAGLVASSVAFSLAHCHSVLLDASQWAAFAPQAGVTFLFGLYSYHIYSQTRSVATCSVVHVLCNYGGCPTAAHFARPQVMLAQVAAALIAVLFI